jgi:diguanylate cyclase (GGDEF)-like protein
VNFELEPSDGGDRPDAWTSETGPESLRSLMFHSNDDLSWPARDLEEPAAPLEAETPVEPAPPLEPASDHHPLAGHDPLPGHDPAAGFTPVDPDESAVPADPDRSPEDEMDQFSQGDATGTTDEAGATGAMIEHGGASTGPVAPSGWSDTITSTDGPHYWDRLMSSERDRVRRYHRPATIVFIEVAHLDRLGRMWGEDVAAQSLVRVGRTVMRQIRSSDHAARIDVSRFAVFLPETDEIAAINFVERVRGAIETSLGNMAETVTVAIGWASPTDGDLDVALELAESRLSAELAADA